MSRVDNRLSFVQNFRDGNSLFGFQANCLFFGSYSERVALFLKSEESHYLIVALY